MIGTKGAVKKTEIKGKGREYSKNHSVYYSQRFLNRFIGSSLNIRSCSLCLKDSDELDNSVLDVSYHFLDSPRGVLPCPFMVSFFTREVSGNNGADDLGTGDSQLNSETLALLQSESYLASFSY